MMPQERFQKRAFVLTQKTGNKSGDHREDQMERSIQIEREWPSNSDHFEASYENAGYKQSKTNYQEWSGSLDIFPKGQGVRRHTL